VTLRVSHDPHDTRIVLVLLDKHTAKLNDKRDGSFAVSGTEVDVYTSRTRRSPGNRLNSQQELACQRAEPPPAGQRLAQRQPQQRRPEARYALHVRAVHRDGQKLKPQLGHHRATLDPAGRAAGSPARGETLGSSAGFGS